MTEKEIVEHLKHMHDGIDELPYECEMNRDIEAIQEVLQLLEQKDNKINKVIDKLKEVQEEFINYCPDCVDLANDILKILEE